MSLIESFIPYGRQDVGDADIAAVVEVLRSDWLTQGPAIERFESALRDATGASYALAVSNATAALHIACLALGVRRGDRVWTSPNSFVASANCALYCGATVDFVDIDPATLNISISALTEKLEQAALSGSLPKVVIPVHFAGEPCDMEAIGALAKRFGFSVIEDASHAVGGRYGAHPVGACAYSDVTVFSFHPVKIVTTGEGGAALTQNTELAAKMARLRTHGITRSLADMHEPEDGAWYYQQIDLGFNYRMTDIQAALGASQMTRLHEFVARRHELAKRYDMLLEGLPLCVPTRSQANYSALHLYPIRLNDASRRKSVFEGMRDARIGVNVLYIPIHTQPFYRDLGFARGDFPVAEDYYSRSLALPMFPGLTEAEQDRVVSTLTGLLA